MSISGRKLNKNLIQRLSTCEYIAEKHNIIVLGATGAGKSYIAWPLARLSLFDLKNRKIWGNLKCINGSGLRLAFSFCQSIIQGKALAASALCLQ